MNVMNTIQGEAITIEDRKLVDRHGRSRAGAYMHVSNGRKYFPFDPREDEVDIQVIAHHLACNGRYNGATQHRRFKSRIFYSVAEHSVYVANYLRMDLKRPDLALEGLLHDASEAFIGDLIRPLKYSPEFRAPFFAVEEINEVIIGRAFNLVYPFPKEIKQADEAVTAAEVEQIIVKHPEEEFESGLLHDPDKVAPYEIAMFDPFAAKEMFLATFYALVEERDKFRPLPEAFRV